MRVFKYLIVVILLIITLNFMQIRIAQGAQPYNQLMVNVLQSPTPFKANDKYYLVYEDYLTNFETSSITLTSLNVNQFAFTQKALEQMVGSIASIQPVGGGYRFILNKNQEKGVHIRINFGFSEENKQNLLTLKSGESKLIYVWLPFDQMKDIPNELTQSVNYEIPTSDKSKTASYSVVTLPLKISKMPPIIVGLPLKGSHWVAVNGPSNTSQHRISHIVYNGRLYFAQRYAIDFVQIDDKGQTYKGDELDNKSYYCYGQNVYSVASGTVVQVVDHIPENTPNNGTRAVDMNFDTVGGNHVVIQLDKIHYAFYAHLIPGSITVKKGDIVKAGQIIGKLGNSGNSSEPHLHFHIVDSPSFITANGIPYGFKEFYLDNKDRSGKLLTYKNPVKKLNQSISEDTVVNFS